MASANSQKDPHEMHALKLKAMKYYQDNGVPIKMEQILNSMFYEDPPDVYGHLVNFFEQFVKPATLQRVIAQQAIDSLGQPVVQCNVYCTVNNKDKLLTTLQIANANLKVKLEEKEKAELELQESVKSAIQIINEELSSTFIGLDPMKLSDIDSLILSVVEKKNEEDLEKKAKEAENQEDQPPPTADEKEKKKSAKKPGKSSTVVEVVPEKLPEYFIPGSEIISAISQSVCVCAAVAQKIPIYRHIANISRTKGAVNEFRLPLPMVTIVQSGKLGVGKVRCIKEYMVIPGPEISIEKSIAHIQNIFNYVEKCFHQKLGVVSKFVNEIGALCPPVDVPTQVLDLLQEAVNGEGLTIGEDMFLAINAAAHECFDYEKGKYETVQGTFKSGDEMVEFWADILNKYPSICAVIDPLRLQESDAWMKLCERVSEGVFIVGDHYYDRPGLLLKEDLPDPITTSGIVFNLERMNSVTDVINCANKFKGAKNEIVIAVNQAEITETFIVDLAVGLDAKFFKLGGPCRGERSTKLNRLLQIHSELEPTIQVVKEEDTQNDSFTEADEVAEEKELEIVKEEKKTWGHDENNRLKLHEPFFYPMIKIKPPSLDESEVQGENEEKVIPPSPKKGK